MSAKAQSIEADSLKRSLAKTTQDSSRVLLLSDLCKAYWSYKPDTALLLAQQGLSLAKQIRYPRGEGYCLARIGQVFNIIGNYPKALEILLQSLKIAERVADPRLTAVISNDIGYTYAFQEDYREGLRYTFKAKQIAEALHNEMDLSVYLLNIGVDYQGLNQLDSARIYTQQSYELAMRLHDIDGIGFAMQHLGVIYAKMGEPALALDYYRHGVADFTAVNNQDNISRSTIYMAELFKETGQKDSALYYAKLCMSLASKGSFRVQELEASTFLAGYWKANHRMDSAFAYMEISIADKDSLFSQEKVRQVQNLAFVESLRQQELAEQRLKEAETAKKNLQFAGIAIFIPVFSLFVLFLSRKKVKHRTIEFLGILALLLIFEFITLLIHPFIEHWTHDTPVFMLLTLVAIAAFLVPLHHKLEAWAKQRLTHKVAVTSGLQKRS